MKVLTSTVARILFAIPFAVFGLFHFINGNAMAGFIPSWLPGRVVWVYLSGAALILGAVSLMIQKQVKWAAGPRAGRSAGLFHVAFRYAGRKELATALRRFLNQRYPIGGAADHLVSDAIYLEDPDGNGVELCRDHPRDTWARRGDQLAMSTKPLDVEALLAESSGIP